MAESNAVAKTNTNQLTHSERFVNMVTREFSSNVAGTLQLSEYQKTLVQGYFIAVDRALKAAEEERIRKNGNNKDPKWNNELPVTWDTVNRTALALDVVHYAKMGLDMMQPNHLFAIPFKNNKKNQYDINLMPGYNGIRYIAEKYAVEAPVAVTTEVVYSTDKFNPIKKSLSNKIESYEFEITNAFDRGNIVGGFAYIEYKDATKNELILMSMKDIEKRKPKHASANFWGGTTKEWKNGKQVEVETDGWLDEMVRKTLIREAYSAKHIPLDPKKVDDAYQHMKLQELRFAEMEAQASIDTNANMILIDSDSGEVVEIEDDAAEVSEVSEVSELPSETTDNAPTAQTEAETSSVTDAPSF